VDEAQRLKKKKLFAEEMGLMFESMGLPRMAGRLLGWLLVCEPPHQSMSELTGALSASKASISNTTRMLIEMGLIERISLPDYRHDHYRIKSGAWYQIVKRRAAQIAIIRRLAERGLALVEGEEPALKSRLAEMHDMYAFFEQQIPVLLECWQKQRQVDQEPEF
jgi:DNA-binding transcriptional regulator GbsR (MarR family)